MRSNENNGGKHNEKPAKQGHNQHRFHSSNYSRRYAVFARPRSTGVIVNLSPATQIATDVGSARNIANVIGTSGNDTITALAAGSILSGNGGTDVLKALCLGASGVLVGRPYLYALAVGGAEGVRAMLAMLRDEMAVSMTLLGVKSVSELSEDLLVRI